MSACIDFLKEKVLAGQAITRAEALQLYEAPLEEITAAADSIRRHYCGQRFDICSIVNAKSGRCSENCKFCAQSQFYGTDITTYPLLSSDEIVRQACSNAAQGVGRFSLVTSGRELSEQELEQVCAAVRRIKAETDISVCVSAGLLNEEKFGRLKAAGVTRIHNNLETSENYFPSICTTHKYEAKLASLRAARQAGLEICSGGIMGLGEAPADRIDLALTLRELGVGSVPVNMLNPIAGTPLAGLPRLTCVDMRRIVAVYRFILPAAAIRLAGGRGELADQGRSCFTSGANAAITGDMLTTAGISAAADQKMLRELGYQISKPANPRQ